MREEMHEFAGITYTPITNQFSVVIPNGWRTQLVGYFTTLEKAVEARRMAVSRRENNVEESQ